MTALDASSRPGFAPARAMPRRLALALPIVVAVTGLSVVALAPRSGDNAIDPIMTGSIETAPLFRAGPDEGG